MSEVPPESPAPDDDQPAPLPRWVPTLIGVVLVAIASLAVITGLRYRDQTLVGIVSPEGVRTRRTAAAPSGEPEAGASLVSGGIPQAGELDPDSSPATRMSARRGMRIQATPADAMVYVNNVPVGQASQFDSDDEIYDFAEPGSYTIRLVAPGYRDRAFIVTADESAQAEVARIEAKLEKD